jgi:hypothetical protein
MRAVADGFLLLVTLAQALFCRGCSRARFQVGSRRRASPVNAVDCTSRRGAPSAGHQVDELAGGKRVRSTSNRSGDRPDGLKTTARPQAGLSV